jgi:hypothetical protein
VSSFSTAWPSSSIALGHDLAAARGSGERIFAIACHAGPLQFHVFFSQILICRDAVFFFFVLEVVSRRVRQLSLTLTMQSERETRS